MIEYGKFYELTANTAVVLCDEDTLPPIVVDESVQHACRHGWRYVSQHDVKVGDDGWIEMYIYEKEPKVPSTAAMPWDGVTEDWENEFEEDHAPVG